MHVSTAQLLLVPSLVVDLGGPMAQASVVAKRCSYTVLIDGVTASNIRGGFDSVFSWSGSGHSDAMVQRKGVGDDFADSRVQKIVNPGGVRRRNATDRARGLNHLLFLIFCRKAGVVMRQAKGPFPAPKYPFMPVEWDE
jgi:hypothetical protein